MFDEDAARSVMAHYQAEGVDVPIDLEHDAWNPQAVANRSDARDARGWFKLELRSDGSLWAVDVKWTPDGERRLREKTQRYTSAAFKRDPQTRRITRLLNVAITSLPCTYDAAPLVAASRAPREMSNGERRARDLAIAIGERRLARMQTSCQRKTGMPATAKTSKAK